MQRVHRAVLVTCLLASLFPGCAPRRVPLGSMRSTLGGVFTAVQASRGSHIYMDRCRACHSAINHTATFKSRWNGRTLRELQRYIKKTMPGDSPGSLPAEDYTMVIAYMLQMIGMPTGAHELPAGKVALRAIRLDTLPVVPGPQ